MRCSGTVSVLALLASLALPASLALLALGAVGGEWESGIVGTENSQKRFARL